MFGELKKATNEFKDSMEVESKMADVKKAFDGINEKEIIDKAETVSSTGKCPRLFPNLPAKILMIKVTI